MQLSKNTFTGILMVSSLALLLILQALWLQSVREKAFDDLRRETGFLFRATLTAMKDSVLVKNIEQIRVDSLPAPGNPPLVTEGLIGSAEKKDRAKAPSRVQIVVQSPEDSLKDNVLFETIAAGIRDIPGENKPGLRRIFIVRSGTDSLNMDTLSVRYQTALHEAGIDARFTISHFNAPPGELYDRTINRNDSLKSPGQPPLSTLKIKSPTIRYELAGIDPADRYILSLTGMQSHLMRMIMPQILFSVFLTLVIASAFIVMQQSIRSQERLMKLKNDFINNITHELKTPVATVSVAIEALKNFKALDNPELTGEYLDIAQNELNRLTLMTDKILSTSSFEKGTMTFSPEQIDLDAMIRQILTSMKLVFEKRKAEVTYNTDVTATTSKRSGNAGDAGSVRPSKSNLSADKNEGDRFILEGSRTHLSNVIYNLIDNALKYSSGNPLIRIHLEQKGDHLIFSVKDNGMGIQPEFQKKIFEKFFRVPTGDVHNVKGYGLGLSYVSAVVKDHGGSVTVDSTPGQGSCFMISLPKKPEG
jgi:two-component system phosphate regulon sensor histidine kinase PhoR